MDPVSWTLLVATAVYVLAAAGFAVGLSRSGCGGRSSAQPFVSVVVAARNEAGYIEGCLASLLDQTYPADRFEVLVVDDDSDDDTSERVARMAAAHANLKCLSVEGAFPEMAAKKRPLSVGIGRARGELILTTDADCRVPRTWISGMAACFEPGVGAVIGFSQIGAPGSPLRPFERLQAFDFLALMSAAAGAANLGWPLAASGQNLAYRRALFEKIGGFRDIGHRPSGDDVLLVQLMRRARAGRIVFASHPGTFVRTQRTETFRGFWRQRRRWASNAPYQFRLNRPFFAYIAAVFLINFLAPLGLVLGTPHRLPALACWGAKALADAVVLRAGARTFGRRDLLPLLPLWELLQAPYTVLVGLFSLLGGFTWKGRRHR